jgi:hypothetical protein
MKPMSVSDQQPTALSESAVMPAASVSAFRWDGQSKRIYGWLREQGGLGFAENYKGAAMLMYTKWPGYVRFVSHALRDILNRFPAVMTKEEVGRVEYVQQLDRILAGWTAEKLPRGPIVTSSGALEAQVTGRFVAVTISPKLAEQLVELLDDHEQGRARSVDNPLRFLEICIPESAGRPDLLASPREQWKLLQKDAVHLTHENGGGCDEEDEAACTSLFQRFEMLLSSLSNLAGSYYQSLENLDAILEEANH